MKKKEQIDLNAHIIEKENYNNIFVSDEADLKNFGFKKKFNIDKSVYKRVLITGAESYVGESFREWVKTHHPSNFIVNTIDMTKPEWKNADFSGYDTVFHVAGIAHADIENLNDKTKRKYYEVNTRLAINTAKKSKREGVRQFVFMSSMIIYGESAPYREKKIIDENTIPAPANFYGDSKWQADKRIRELNSNDFQVAVIRSPMIFGKGSKGNYPLLKKIANIVPIFPDIQNQRSMIHIDNLCEFISLLIMSGEGGIYFPQNREYATTSLMVKEIGELSGKRIWLSKILNPMVGICSHIPGRIGLLTNKAFGNCVYEQTISQYNGLEYVVRDFKEAIRLTEDRGQSTHSILNQPMVSVITAAYNCDLTIGKTIESVQKQSYKNWEMLIVDDGSSDNTIETVSTYLKKDARIKLILLEKNLGAAVARNVAIKKSSGRFVAFLDSDDLWKPQKLEKQISFMLQNNYAFTFTAYDVFHESSDIIRKVYRVPKSINYKQYLRNTIIGNLTVVMDKEKIPNLYVEQGYLEDVLTWMHYLKAGYIAYGLNENLASYRISINSKSGNKIKNAKRYFQCLRKGQQLPIWECLVDEICYIFNALQKRVFSKTVLIERD